MPSLTDGTRREASGPVDLDLLMTKVCKLAQQVIVRDGKHDHICILIKGDDQEAMILMDRSEYARVQRRAQELDADFVISISEAAMRPEGDPDANPEDVLSIYVYGPGVAEQRLCPFARRGRKVYCGKWETARRMTHNTLRSWWKYA
jgi:hypothetical protein